jgi:hypothetical protein
MVTQRQAMFGTGRIADSAERAANGKSFFPVRSAIAGHGPTTNGLLVQRHEPGWADQVLAA